MMTAPGLPSRARLFTRATGWGALHAVACALVLSCTPQPKLPVLAQVEEQEANTALLRAAKLAPQSFAHAQHLRALADDAHADGDSATAEILADHALAAQQHTLVQARLVRVQERRQGLQGERKRLEDELARMKGLQEAVAAEALALELRVRVVRDAEPLEAAEPGSPGREAARRKAARLLLDDGRLLCLAARMLGASAEALAPRDAALGALEAALDSGAAPVPMHDAYRARSGCLQTLTELRRTESGANPLTVSSSTLLDELSAALPDNPPHRDDRGVVVPLPGPLMQGGALAPTAQKVLATLERVAAAQGEVALLLVVHSEQETGPLLEALKGTAIAQRPGSQLYRVSAARHPAVTRLTNAPKGDWVELIFVKR